MKRKDFDGILIETTGMADPAPVAQDFYVDQGRWPKRPGSMPL